MGPDLLELFENVTDVRFFDRQCSFVHFFVSFTFIFYICTKPFEDLLYGLCFCWPLWHSNIYV